MKDRGTLIRRSPLTETSLIVHWCSYDHGIVKSVAKGARRPKSPFAGKLDLFYLCEIEVHASKTSDLHTLKEVVIERPRLGLRKNYLQTLAASYFVKLIDRVAEPGTPVPELADLLDRGLNYLEENDADWRSIRHFEKQLAGFLGVAEPGIEAFRSLDEAFGKLPEQRRELEQRFAK